MWGCESTECELREGLATRETGGDEASLGTHRGFVSQAV